MNIRLIKALGSILLYFGIITSAQSSLIDYGNGLIYDDHLNLTLLKDMNYSMTSGYDEDGLMSWNEAIIWADQLNFGGFDNWRLPTTAPCNDENYLCPQLGELGHIYYDELFGTLDEGPGWTPPRPESLC